MVFKLEPDEHILFTTRRHWYIPAIETVMVAASLLIPLIVTSVAFSITDKIPAELNIGLLSIIIMTAWFFIAWNIVFIIWTNHFLDVLIVSNKHVFDIEQIGLWNREISTFSLDKIQDISSAVDGIIPHMLNYGDLEIQTAGSNTNFIIKNIQRPDELRHKLNEQISLRFDKTKS